MTKTVVYEAFSEAELPVADAALVSAAKDATFGSYSPYSHFAVGAAVLLDDGTLVKGANQENGAYPSGLCAERTALFAAHAAHPDKRVVAIAIAAKNNGAFLEEPVTPCGSCLQVMVETEMRSGCPLVVLLYGTGVVYRLKGVSSLLPFAFSLK